MEESVAADSHAFGDFLIGASQGLAFTLSGQPFDAVRLNTQTRNISVRQLTAREVAALLYQREGVRGFFAGWTSPAIGFSIARAAQNATMGAVRDFFVDRRRAERERMREEELARARAREAAKERARQWWERPLVALGSTALMEAVGVEPPGRDVAAVLDDFSFSSRMQNDAQLETWKNVVAATAGAVAYTTIHTPFDLVRVRMSTQTQFSHRAYAGALDCAWQLYSCGGMSKLYRGYSAALARDVPSQIIIFGLYGILRPLLPQDERHSINVWHGMLLGGVVGMVQWSLIIPLDNLKTVMQVAPLDAHGETGWFRTGLRIHALYGWRGFYAGLSPALMKAFVSSASLFAVTELVAVGLDNRSRDARRDS